jgi:hypothetical protein
VPGVFLEFLGLESDQSDACRAEIESGWKVASAEVHGFMTWNLMKHREKFAFNLL